MRDARRCSVVAGGSLSCVSATRKAPLRPLSHSGRVRVISDRGCGVRMKTHTVQYGAIEIGFWRAGSSFLKLVVKSGQVGSSFLKNRNPPPRNFASPPLRRRTTRVQRGDVPMHLHQPMGHSEQSKQAWHPTALYHTASGELSGDPSIPPVISPPCLTSWSVRRISCDMRGGVRRRGSFRNWLSLV